MLRKLKLKKLKKRLSRANSLASLIVGLGNPGDEYKKTRHNAGFLFVDRLALSMGWVFSYEAKFKAQVAKGVLAGEVVRLIKPQTFMNKSGYSVAACVKYFDIPADAVLVVHDDLDLEPGVVRLKKDGGHGGHNGLRDIISHLSTKDFFRLRLGVGHPGDKRRVADFVLKSASKEEAGLIEESIDRALNEMPAICRAEYQAVMKELHT